MAKGRYKRGEDGYYRHRETYKGVKIDLRALDVAELETKVRQRKNEIDAGTTLHTGAITVQQWGDTWYNTYIVPSVGVGAARNYRSALAAAVYPAIGAVRLCDVRPMAVQQILNSLAADSKSGAYIGRVRDTLHKLFAAAVSNRLVASSPASDIVLPKAADGTHRALTQGEAELLLSVAGYHKYGLYVLLMYHLGLRPQEACGLLWGDFADDYTLVHISRAVTGGTHDIGDTKSAAGVRDIPVPEELAERLRADRGRSERSEDGDYVLLNEDGKHGYAEQFQRWWQAIRRECNIRLGAQVYRNKIIDELLAPDVTAYCLRHTYCTNLQRAWVPLNVAKYLMGHSDVRMTANIYSHCTDDQVQNAGKMIQSYNRQAQNSAVGAGISSLCGE